MTAQQDASSTGRMVLDFAGELLSAAPGETLRVGRTGDLAIDDNPYLHRDFLAFATSGDLWWVANVGGRIAAYLTEEGGLMRSTLAPGARLPLVFPTTLVTFAAGDTLYELIVTVPSVGYEPVEVVPGRRGETTISPGAFTPSQLLAILALAEPTLRRAGSGAAAIPTTAQAAARLGWSAKRFDKKVENVCDKLSSAGVRGLKGPRQRLASRRRVELVEYAISTLLVTTNDLYLIDLPQEAADENEE